MRQLYILLLWLICITAKGQIFPYRYLSPFIISPSEDTNCMLFDKEGMMWLGTNAGLKSYDGYTVKTFKSDAYSPGILPNNNIRSIIEDHHDNLWLGTKNGLVRMNKRTGTFKTYHLPSEKQSVIYTLYTTKDGTLWIGTDEGLSYFNPKNESFYTYNHQNSWLIDSDGRKQKMIGYSVKAILEDKNGDLLIGTWSSGLMRFKRGSHVMRRYPKINATNSAYSLFFDNHHRLWVGTWGYGVVRIDNPQDVRGANYHQYPYETTFFDTFYKIVEDPVSQKLWACTREGVCYLDENDPKATWQRHTQIGNNKLTFNNDIATDGKGNIWLCTQLDGIIQVTTTPSLFHNWYLDRSHVLNINFLNSMFTQDGEWFWLGLNPYGIALYNRRTQATYYNKEIPGFASLDARTLTTSISSIAKRSNGELWFACNNYGVIVKPQEGNVKMLNHQNTHFIKDDFVTTIFESRDKTMWIGSRSGMGIVFPDNRGLTLTMKKGKKNFSKCDIRHINQDRQGNIWLATDNEGIIRISGNPKSIKSLQYKQYCADNHNFSINDATACLEDSEGRLWAISNSGGLFLYDKESDCFYPKNRDFHLPNVRVFSIQEDANQNLWLATERALVRLTFPKGDLHPENITYYTKEDGLEDVFFPANTSCKYGNELFFANRTSFFSFLPEQANRSIKQRGKSPISSNKKLVITDILIDDVPFELLDSASMENIAKEMPGYTHNIKIPSSVKKFSVEFSLLTYGNAKKNVYAYQLKGYDEDWQYCNGETHQAIFQNLPAGKYQLLLKATDSYGHWQELPYAITIRVLPPWYASRLAYMAYILLLIGGIFTTTRWYKDRLKTRNSLQMGVILTNITHELLTPLTVISATIYKLKEMAPQYEEDYQVMDSNINRTTRLLRQILEVRKSQAGQLRLRVNNGDLIAFVRKACENIRPMAEQQHITLCWDLPNRDGSAWFDTDKLDKILYNLLSNAIKYNNKDGKIDVRLNLNREKATITIADNGIGMSKDKLKHLYTRFFDGDYRKQKQPGTGIGLALTHDLVKLHHGSIDCESKEGEGTTFSVTIPIKKSAYAENEIDFSNKSKRVDEESVKLASLTEQALVSKGEVAEEANKLKIAPIHPRIFIRKNVSKILVVEDNEELLALMLQVLSKNYHVFTAKNGKQAINIIMKEQLDLVVSDVMMPVMDGIELTQRIKADKDFWQLPVILLTAKNKDEDKTEAYSIGADAYITKPFKFEELEVRINALLANRKRIIEKIETEVSLSANTRDDNKEDDAHLSNPDQAFITRATEMVMQHLDDSEYDRKSFAKDMAMGESTLYNKVKATTGQTVVEFITAIRMKEAQRLMQADPNILISEVATRVGFNTPKYFSKCFKKEFGIYPREFADKLKNS